MTFDLQSTSVTSSLKLKKQWTVVRVSRCSRLGGGFRSSTVYAVWHVQPHGQRCSTWTGSAVEEPREMPVQVHAPSGRASEVLEQWDLVDGVEFADAFAPLGVLDAEGL